MKRQDGFYFIRLFDKWTIAYYSEKKRWYMQGDSEYLLDSEVDEVIEERILMPDEKEDNV